MKVTNEYFADIVGQENPKRKLGFYLDSYKETRVVPNFLLAAPKGFGKTTIAKAIGRNLVQFDADGKVVLKDDGRTPKKKTFALINCSTIKSVKQFINSTIVPFVQDKDCTVFFDEASEIPHGVSMALLTMLETNQTQTSFTSEDYTCDIDFRRQSFIFATTEIQKVFHALADRLKRIDLDEYVPKDLAEILQRNVKDVEFEDGLLEDIATVLRGNARNATMLAEDIVRFNPHGKTFKHKDWDKLKVILGILPLGLYPLELNVLRFLRQNVMGTSLTRLSTKTGMSRDSLQKDLELYLQRNDLMTIGTKGREITTKGIQYLNALDGIGSRAKVKAPIDNK